MFILEARFLHLDFVKTGRKNGEAVIADFVAVRHSREVCLWIGYRDGSICHRGLQWSQRLTLRSGRTFWPNTGIAVVKRKKL
jgi:hypothetical protein